MANIKGYNQLSGSSGQLWWEGELVVEIQSFEAKVTVNREDVQIGMDIDSKITSYKGEGTMKVKKMFDRGKNKLLEAWKRGEDPRSTLTYKVGDKDTVGKQQSRGTLENVWFNELTLTSFEKGQLMEEEIPFGFTISDTELVDTIEPV